MSMSLLKLSMSIIEEGLSDNKKSKEKKVTKKKGLHKRDRLINETLNNNTAQKKTIDDIRKELQSDSKKADENVNRLLKLTKHSVKIPNAEKIIRRAHSGKYIVEEKKKPVEQESIFTEEDFAAFEKELEQNI